MGPGHSQNFGNGLWIELVLIVSRMVSHCTGSCRRTYVEYTVGMSVSQLGATNARGVGREWRGNLRVGCMSKLCVE